jgi:hypothetical protein
LVGRPSSSPTLSGVHGLVPVLRWSGDSAVAQLQIAVDRRGAGADHLSDDGKGQRLPTGRLDIAVGFWGPWWSTNIARGRRKGYSWLHAWSEHEELSHREMGNGGYLDIFVPVLFELFFGYNVSLACARRLGATSPQ